MKKLKLKNATIKDVDLILKIRNQINTRRSSFIKKKISKTEHILWFKDFKKNKKNILLMIEYKNKIIGYIKYNNIYEFIYEVSISVISKYINQKFGSEALIKSESYLCSNSIIFSKILNKNIISINFFEKNNYILLNLCKTYKLYYKIIFKRNKVNYKKLINKIELTRKRNNLNWMELLKLSYNLSPLATNNIFKKIAKEDKKINILSKKLTNDY